MPKREGIRRVHSRSLTPKESRERGERRVAERKAQVEAQQRDRRDRTPKGWAGRRAARGR